VAAHRHTSPVLARFPTVVAILDSAPDRWEERTVK